MQKMVGGKRTNRKKREVIFIWLVIVWIRWFRGGGYAASGCMVAT